MLKKEVSIDGTKYKVIINDSQPVNTYTSISGVGKADISNCYSKYIYFKTRNVS